MVVVVGDGFVSENQYGELRGEIWNRTSSVCGDQNVEKQSLLAGFAMWQNLDFSTCLNTLFVPTTLVYCGSPYLAALSTEEGNVGISLFQRRL